MLNTLTRTEFEFRLPGGLVDDVGQVHCQGRMRMATAGDEIAVQKDPRNRDNPAYGTLLVLARVITQLGDLPRITPELLEGLFTRDLIYLREFYNRLNEQGDPRIPVQCPHCSGQFQVELELSGES